MMSRTILVVCVVVILLSAACTGKDLAQEGANEQVSQQEDVSTGAVSQPDGDTDTETPMRVPPGEDPAMIAQDLMRHGDMEGALAILENMSAAGPMTDDLSALLIDAHLRYVNQIAMNRQVELSVLNDVLFSHYMRVLELDPENEEAIAGMNSVRFWYEGHGVTPPEAIDPLAFLPTEETEEVDAEPEESEGE